MISSLTASPSNRFVDKFLPHNCKSSWTHACIVDTICIECCCLHVLQMTWVPNELEGANLILFEFLDLLMEPKGDVQHTSTSSLITLTYVLFTLSLCRLVAEAMGVCQ